MAEFSKSNSHEQNMKVSIDKILGTDTVVKRSRKTAEDHKRALFNQFIDGMLFISNRSGELDSNFCLDMGKYDSVFLDTIEVVLKLYFNKKQLELIYFFLYDRIDVEGNVLEVFDEDNKQPIAMNNPDQLWESIKRFK